MNLTRAANTRALDALAAWARRHGGRLIRASRERSLAQVSPRYQEAPFGAKTIDGSVDEADQLGIIWEEKRVFCSPNVIYPDVIHEFGHVFAALCRPSMKDATPNEEAFFAWELLMAQRLGPKEIWYECNEGYSINTGSDFGAVSAAEQAAFLQRSTEAGIKAGCIVRGKPVAIR